VVELFHLFWGTLLLRPYVFFFLSIYFFACTAWFGFRVTLAFLVLGYGIAFASEFASIHIGFPYGWYYYIPATVNRELWVAGVPFMDSISYVFLAFASYSLSLFIRSPLKVTRWETGILDAPDIQSSLRTLLLAACLFVFIDVIVDPLSLQGDRFFLGKIYGYREEGLYFGIPLSNFGGWFLVGLALVFALQVLVRWLRAPETKPGVLAGVRWNRLWGPALYWVIVLGNLGMTFWIGEIILGLVGAAMTVIILGWISRVTVNKLRYFRRNSVSSVSL
jgi:putative membrane protein